jgi:hypothetical protein
MIEDLHEIVKYGFDLSQKQACSIFAGWRGRPIRIVRCTLYTVLHLESLCLWKFGRRPYEFLIGLPIPGLIENIWNSHEPDFCSNARSFGVISDSDRGGKPCQQFLCWFSIHYLLHLAVPITLIGSSLMMKNYIYVCIVGSSVGMGA